MSKPSPSGSRPHDAKRGEKGTPMTPIPSASLIVLCPISSSTSLSTLVLQRSSRQNSSFRSAVVFPGGALDLADDHATGSNPDTKDLGDGKYLEALKLCSLRETFEETGLLLIPSLRGDAKGMNGKKEVGEKENWGLPVCRAVGAKESGIEKEEWARIREEVHNDASKFVPFLSQITFKIHPTLKSSSSSSLPPLAPINHHSEWVTPKGVVRPGKRFDAHFFITLLDTPDVMGKIQSSNEGKGQGEGDEGLGLSADGSETTSLRIDTAENLCKAAMNDKIVLFPPQFYILADLAATLSSPNSSSTKKIVPLIFNSPSASPTSTFSSPIISKIEEEPRLLSKKENYSWDRKDEPVGLNSIDSNSSTSTSTSIPTKEEPKMWVKPPMSTCVEPKPLPSQGSNVASDVIKTGESGQFETDFGPGGKTSISTKQDGSVEAEDEPFVFPLVLPGDWRASEEQKRNAGLPQSGSGNEKSLNRVFCSPRTKAEGGGLVVRGAMRKGVGQLMDFRMGICLEEKIEDEDEEESVRAKL